MSHYYLEHPHKAEQVLSNALHLRSSLHMPLIFVLLFHEYVRLFALFQHTATPLIAHGRGLFPRTRPPIIQTSPADSMPLV